MKTYNILIIIIFFILLNACKKRNEETFTIKGKLLNNCSGEVMGNTNIDFQNKQGYSWMDGVEIYSKTDSEGNFSVIYSYAGGDKIKFNVSGYRILEDIPINENIDLGLIYYAPTCNYIVKVQVNNPYLSKDSLVIYRLNNNGPGGVHFPTPLTFSDTLLIVNDFYSIITPTYRDLNKVSVRIGYNLYKPDHTVDHYFYYDTLIPACNWPPDTLILTIN